MAPGASQKQTPMPFRSSSRVGPKAGRRFRKLVCPEVSNARNFGSVVGEPGAQLIRRGRRDGVGVTPVVLWPRGRHPGPGPPPGATLTPASAHARGRGGAFPQVPPRGVRRGPPGPPPAWARGVVVRRLGAGVGIVLRDPDALPPPARGTPAAFSFRERVRRGGGFRPSAARGSVWTPRTVTRGTGPCRVDAPAGARARGERPPAWAPLPRRRVGPRVGADARDHCAGPAARRGPRPRVPSRPGPGTGRRAVRVRCARACVFPSRRRVRAGTLPRGASDGPDPHRTVVRGRAGTPGSRPGGGRSGPREGANSGGEVPTGGAGPGAPSPGGLGAPARPRDAGRVARPRDGDRAGPHAAGRGGGTGLGDTAPVPACSRPPRRCVPTARCAGAARGRIGTPGCSGAGGTGAGGAAPGRGASHGVGAPTAATRPALGTRAVVSEASVAERDRAHHGARPAPPSSPPVAAGTAAPRADPAARRRRAGRPRRRPEAGPGRPPGTEPVAAGDRGGAAPSGPRGTRRGPRRRRPTEPSWAERPVAASDAGPGGGPAARAAGGGGAPMR